MDGSAQLVDGYTNSKAALWNP